MQAGTSKAGKSFAAKHAEAIFIAGHSPSVVAKNVAEVRSSAKELGRDPQNVKFLAMICPVLGRTQEDAERRFEEYSLLGSIERALALFGGWTGIDMARYGDDEELRHVESNAIQSVALALSCLIEINLSKIRGRSLVEIYAGCGQMDQNHCRKTHYCWRAWRHGSRYSCSSRR